MVKGLLQVEVRQGNGNMDIIYAFIDILNMYESACFYVNFPIRAYFYPPHNGKESIGCLMVDGGLNEGWVASFPNQSDY